MMMTLMLVCLAMFLLAFIGSIVAYSLIWKSGKLDLHGLRRVWRSNLPGKFILVPARLGFLDYMRIHKGIKTLQYVFVVLFWWGAFSLIYFGAYNLLPLNLGLDAAPLILFYCLLLGLATSVTLIFSKTLLVFERLTT